MFDLQSLLHKINRPKPDPRLPACPVCGASALESAYRYAEDLLHDCDCHVHREAEYYRGLRRLWEGRLNVQRFIESLPRLYQGYTFEKYSREPGNAEALSIAQRIRWGEFLFLYGKPGRGKTHLVVAAARRLAEAGHKSLFLGEADYLEALYRSFRAGAEPPDYRGVDVLVLDDLGKIKPSEFAYQTLYSLVEHFSSQGKSLLISSNYSPVQAARRLAGGDADAAAAIASRLSKGYVLEVGGVDCRCAQ